jgi:hypothetical protein
VLSGCCDFNDCVLVSGYPLGSELNFQVLSNAGHCKCDTMSDVSSQSMVHLICKMSAQAYHRQCDVFLQVVVFLVCLGKIGRLVDIDNDREG